MLLFEIRVASTFMTLLVCWYLERGSYLNLGPFVRCCTPYPRIDVPGSSLHVTLALRLGKPWLLGLQVVLLLLGIAPNPSPAFRSYYAGFLFLITSRLIKRVCILRLCWKVKVRCLIMDRTPSSLTFAHFNKCSQRVFVERAVESYCTPHTP